MNEFLVAAILALGISRIILCVTKDVIFAPVRGWVYKYSPEEPKYNEEDGTETRAGFFGQVISCPDCFGVWAAAGLLGAFYLWPVPVLYFLSVFAVSMVASIIARVY